MTAINHVNSIDKYHTTLQPYQLEQLDFLQNWLNIIRPKVILDAGCATGLLTAFINIEAEWTGIDVSEAINLFHGKGILGDITSMPFDDNSFDVVLCVDVLEHLSNSDLQKAVSELARSAKHSVIIIVPNEIDIGILKIKCLNCGELFHTDGHNKCVEVNDLQTIMNDYGFKLAHTDYVGDVIPYGNEIIHLMFKKRMLEQLLYYPFSCTKCNEPISSKLNQCDEQTRVSILDSLYSSLKYNWFESLQGSLLTKSEKCFVFTKEQYYDDIINSKVVADSHYDNDTFTQMPQTLDINKRFCRKISPFALPAYSYIVYEDSEELDKDTLLTNKVYKVFLALSCNRLEYKLTSECNGVFSIKYIDNESCWNTVEAHITKGTNNDEVLLEVPPLLGVEGTYFEISLITESIQSFYLRLLPKSDKEESLASKDDLLEEDLNLFIYQTLLNTLIYTEKSKYQRTRLLCENIKNDLNNQLKDNVNLSEKNKELIYLLNKFDNDSKEGISPDERYIQELGVWVKLSLNIEQQYMQEIALLNANIFSNEERSRKEIEMWQKQTLKIKQMYMEDKYKLEQIILEQDQKHNKEVEQLQNKINELFISLSDILNKKSNLAILNQYRNIKKSILRHLYIRAKKLPLPIKKLIKKVYFKIKR